ncbi:Bug family tripartite tricarboxylate transporter substrate binding protein [Caenimonas koreensis]|uniref:Bug family tripartite tricarboxylate transporter substrate binding protein n=1 Tax=Caenimonas koreensis TaxID=367474 RepID=UPI0037837379
MTRLSSLKSVLSVAVTAALLTMAPAAQAAWEPTKAVEFVVPAGTGGGADQMARLIQGVVIKYKLMKEPMIVVNKSGGAGAEGFLDVKGSKGDPHKLVVTLSNLFTTPLATGVPFNWRDMTPVSMMALDNFVLWVNADTPYQTAKQYLDATKAAGPNKMKMGGTGSKQEDQILTVGIEKATGTKFIYVPFKGGGEVAVQLVGKHIDSTVNNPIEAVAQWRAGQLRALCVFDEKRMPYKEKITDKQSWYDVPTCKEAGVPTTYTMLRGVFMAPGVTKEQTDFYVNLLKKVRETPEWKDYMEKGAFNQTSMTGDDYVKWLGKAENDHRELMKEAGFMAK